MRQRFYLYRRRGTYYLQDSRTGKQQSLDTQDRNVAHRVLELKRQTATDPGYNQFVLRACLATQDPLLSKRTWQTVMDQIQTHGKDSSRIRYERAMKCQAFNSIRKIKLVETTAEDLLAVMSSRKVSVVHYLKRLHNLALGLGWIAFPVLAPRLWPKPHFKPKRAITLEEHQRILAAESNRERKLYYQLLWEIGASQSDAAELTVENIDRATNSLTYFRKKTGEQAQLAISKSLAAILVQLPQTGPLFPNICAQPVNLRAAEFYYLCKRLKIAGITLHSYRYAWAERAKTCGYPASAPRDGTREHRRRTNRRHPARPRRRHALDTRETRCGRLPATHPRSVGLRDQKLR